MSNQARRRSGALLVALALGAVPAAAYAAGEQPELSAPAHEAFKIVSLGDSVSLGYEPGVTRATDIYGYADRLYVNALLHGRAELANYGALGLQSAGLTQLLAGAAQGRKLTADQLQDYSAYDPAAKAQADAVAASAPALRDSLADADLVTLTIGGNDFAALVRDLVGKTDADATASFEKTFDEKLNNYAEQLQANLRTLRSLAPQARIEVADQYSPVSKIVGDALYAQLNASIAKLSAKLDELKTSLAAEGVAVDIVHIGAAFQGKEVQYTHFSPIFGVTDIHPTQAGYESIARAFAAPVWPEYTEVAPSDKAADPAPTVYIKGKLLKTQNKPQLKSNTTFLALSDIAAATGAELQWDNKNKTATFKQNGREVKLTIGAKTIVVGGVKQALNVPAYLQTVGKESKTYVPLAAITQGLDYQVVYQAKLHTAFINS
ncbi:stalk domain-containing protein [Cohnella hashimotonis]|uniref:Stalk domain-containing protein n=1 Tax=Cohnella hashimotonis TaxID=2826895 RepID=A0ABT6TE67_9BACL|nr:stalk domain-containing protein [Cohnella hashimotonis]MDI4644142.1 stalk domain-containing protein [Cohnella hashimotonis]